MVLKKESKKHEDLVTELVDILEGKGHRIDGVDLEEWEDKPEIVENENGIGDGEDKQPDIDAFDEDEEIYIRGEAKVGNSDIESEHSITQYLLFSSRCSSKNNKSSLLFIIVPKDKKQELNDVVVENVPEKNWENIKLISSELYEN